MSMGSSSIVSVSCICENPETDITSNRKTKNIFEKLKENVSNENLKYLSMGMSNSYKTAIEEGANMVRLGTVIFGRRSCDINSQQDWNFPARFKKKGG